MTPDRNLRITFHLDGTGLYYDPAEPPMFDAILSAIRCRFHVHGEPPTRDQPPAEIPLPLASREVNGQRVWCASALFPVEEEALRQVVFWRKRFRQGRADMTDGSPNLSNGVYRDWNAPLPLLMTRALQCWVVYRSDAKPSRLRHDLLSDVRYIGRKRAHGRGQVVGITIDRVEEDWSLVRDGLAMRYLPHPEGSRIVRPRPPYWNIVGAVPCMDIGEPFSLP